MKVYFHDNFYTVYTSDPAAAPGRMEAVVDTIAPHVDICSFSPATQNDLLTVHPKSHLERIRRKGLYEIAALAAGGAIQAAQTGMDEPSFALIRPPGHHASADSCWGFCFFNNMAVSLHQLRSTGRIETAFILDFDLHYGDGNVNILGNEPWVEILNAESHSRQAYLDQVKHALHLTAADVIAVSAGFDNHVQDWGGLLTTADYRTMGTWVHQAAKRNNGGCYGILEGGYNHDVLGKNVLAFLEGLIDNF
ncbi:MAG: histone deacetylase family protein [Desulfosarcina sp.]|nr:histone deacetylase family protein [Desulfosarcina sp.]MBC2766195.1 histone deacetylase family protein [Desulfosarcina sp.]